MSGPKTVQQFHALLKDRNANDLIFVFTEMRIQGKFIETPALEKIMKMYLLNALRRELDGL